MAGGGLGRRRHAHHSSRLLERRWGGIGRSRGGERCSITESYETCHSTIRTAVESHNGAVPISAWTLDSTARTGPARNRHFAHTVLQVRKSGGRMNVKKRARVVEQISTGIEEFDDITGGGVRGPASPACPRPRSRAGDASNKIPGLTHVLNEAPFVIGSDGIEVGASKGVHPEPQPMLPASENRDCIILSHGRTIPLRGNGAGR
jgi:hypothetical protein